ncbi:MULTISPECIES: ATP-binding protein [unclassified Anaeromyxobacter]|uniref:ATP-binding protein n=1 Tax=unclassified Anaeromyxobacter TaxID=2620896 RepID=UPI001F5681C0|nr:MULTISPECIES: ATP-binding protein [unclassified Anaeromyxobacter]
MDAPKDIPLLDPKVVARMHRISQVAAALAGGIGVGALVSHPLGVPWLRTLARGIEVQPNTAAGIIAAAVGLSLAGLGARWARIASRVIGVLVAALGAATLVEHLALVDLHIDRVLVPGLGLSAAVTLPGRPGPPAAASFLLAGVVLVGLDARRRAAWLAQGLAIVAMAIALLGVVGHTFDVSLLYREATVTGIAFPSAIALLTLDVGLLCARPDRGFVANLASTGAGSALARRLLVYVLLLPLLLGGLALAVTGASGEGALAVSLLVVVLSLLFVVLVLRDAVAIDRMELAKLRAQEAHAASREELARALAREQDARVHAEAASRSKDEFLATLSHELRTPLNAILGWSGLLRDAGGDPERLARGLAVIERNGRTLAQLVSDLLDMSRIAAGKIEVGHADVDLLGVVDDAVEAVRATARAKGVALSRTAGPELPRVVGDAARLRQVAWNLLSNAVKFTQPGGSVDVRLAASRGGALLEVKDTGVGMARDFLPVVFDPFVHAEGASVRRHGGLGLGLAITRQLVALHGGTIEAESDGPGRGATFRVVLPPVARAPAVAPAAVSARPDLGGARVLVVDDEADSRDVLLQLLASWGARPEGAASVREALDAVARERPDLVVSDIAMPGEDGFTFVHELRRLEEARGERRVAIAALTAFARPEDRQRAIAAGFDAHLAKPVDPATLHATIAGLLRDTRVPDAAAGPQGTAANPDAPEPPRTGGEDARAAG